MAPDGGTVETVLATDASVIQTVMDGVETIYVVPKDQPALMKLSLTWQGSDGMSDTIYPYDGEILIEKDSNLFGGCRSTTKEPRMPEGLEE